MDPCTPNQTRRPTGFVTPQAGQQPAVEYSVHILTGAQAARHVVTDSSITAHDSPVARPIRVAGAREPAQRDDVDDRRRLAVACPQEP